MIVMLDDIGRATYKKLKVESDTLLRIRSAIKCKKKMVAALTDEWLEYEKDEIDDLADKSYAVKYKVELELQELERSEKVSLQRIQKYVNTKTRGA